MSTAPAPFSAALLALDPARETERIAAALRRQLAQVLKRRGLVVGLSGGVDSTVTAALAVRALGPDHVFGLLMPERHSETKSEQLGREVGASLGIATVCEDITGLLEAAGHYRRYTEAVRQLFPAFDASWQSKLVIDGPGQGRSYTTFALVARDPAGALLRARLPHTVYLEIVAATGFKQRTRKMLEYYHADRLNYAVAGTPNRLEYDQGFFVKNGDGAADLKPIAHLYKTQVYQLAEYLQAPSAVRQRQPTTDTYSMPQSQDEFYFGLPYAQMDLCLYGKNHGYPAAQVAAVAGLEVVEVERVWRDIDRKRATTRYQHLPALLVESVPELTPPPSPPGAAAQSAFEHE